MAFVQWSPELDVGDEEMNRQHVRLIDIINRYHDALELHAPRAELLKIFEEVAAFAQSHFRDEEALMEACAFPGLTRHRLIHKQLVARVGELLVKLRDTGDEAVKSDIQYFLKNWLTAHIKGIDSQYRPIVSNRRGAAGRATASPARISP